MQAVSASGTSRRGGQGSAGEGMAGFVGQVACGPQVTGNCLVQGGQHAEHLVRRVGNEGAARVGKQQTLARTRPGRIGPHRIGQRSVEQYGVGRHSAATPNRPRVFPRRRVLQPFEVDEGIVEGRRKAFDPKLGDDVVASGAVA